QGAQVTAVGHIHFIAGQGKGTVSPLTARHAGAGRPSSVKARRGQPHLQARPSRSLSPIGGEGWGDGASQAPMNAAPPHPSPLPQGGEGTTVGRQEIAPGNTDRRPPLSTAGPLKFRLKLFLVLLVRRAVRSRFFRDAAA